MSGLGELAKRWGLSERQIEQLALMLDLLASDEGAPSSVRGGAALDVHVADSLSALALEPVAAAGAIADIGSGAGFPGIVLAIALPNASVALVESLARKCAFLERALDVAGVQNARIVNARAEEWSQGLGENDLVTARAVAPLAVLCEYAAPLLDLGGALVAWKGEVSAEEADGGRAAALVLGLRSNGAVRSEPYAGSVAHHLHLYTKVARTPDGYPRRSGMARKRPLGGSG